MHARLIPSRMVPLLAVLLLMSISLRAQDVPAVAPALMPSPDAVPMLLYQSSSHDRYIIERADGTDSREIRAERSPEDNYLGGAGWSPSGEWFAWSSGGYGYGNGFTARTFWLTHRSGTKPVSFISFPLIHSQARWVHDFSGAEKLEIIYTEARPNAKDNLVVLIDPMSGEAISYDGAPQWSPTHEWFFYTQYYEDAGVWRNKLVIGGADGSLTERDNARVEWSPTGELITFPSTDPYLIFEALTAATVTQVELPSCPEQLDWRPDGQFAVFETLPCDSRGEPVNTQFWLLDHTTNEIHLISESLGDGIKYYSNRMMWNTDWSSVSSWSPDGQQVVYWTTAGIMMYDVLQRRSVNIGIDTRELAHEIKMVWLPDSSGILTLWGETLWLAARDSSQARIIAEGVKNFEPSPDGRYIAVGGRAACQDEWSCIYDIAGQIVTLIPRHSSAIDVRDYADFKWHPTAPWLLVSQLGDASIFPYTMAVNISGTVRRELNQCFLRTVCVDWVPSTVTDAEILGTPVTLPSLPETEVYIGSETVKVAWSPSGSQIAVAAPQGTYILDGITLATRHKLPPTEGTTVEWVSWDAEERYLLVGRSNVSVYQSQTTDTRQFLTRYALSRNKAELVGALTGDEIRINADVVAVRPVGSDVIDLLNRDTFESFAQLPDSGVMELSNNNRLAVLTRERGDLHIWQIDPDAEMPLMLLSMFKNAYGDNGYQGRVLTLGPQGRWVALNSAAYGPSRIWNVDAQALIVEEGPRLWWLSFSDDYVVQHINEVGNEALRVLSVETQESLTELHFGGDAYAVLHVAQDGSSVIYFEENKIALWDVKEGKDLLTRASWLYLRRVPTLAVSPDETLLALSSQPGDWSLETLEVYDLTQRPITPMRRINRQASLIAWNPGGTAFVAVTGHTLSRINVK